MKASVITKLGTIGLGVLFVHLSTSQLIGYQGNTKIIISNFEMVGRDSAWKNLSSLIPKTLAVVLSSSKEIEVTATAIDSARLGSTKMQTLKDTVDYFVIGEFWEDSGILRVKGEVINTQTRKIEFNIKAATEDTTGTREEIAELLADQLTQYMIIGLSKRIRIGIVNFRMVGGDTTLEFLEEKIPVMLVTDLSVSPKLTFIERDRDTLFQKIEKTTRLLEGMYEKLTRLVEGKHLIENYLIMGDFCEHNGKMRIDVRCVSILTSEIIVSEGINLDKVDLSEIAERITTLAYKILISIERDLSKRDVGKLISVVGLPPTPDTKPNRLRTEHIIRAVSRKLKTVDTEEIKIKEDQKKVHQYINNPTDRFGMTTELGVSKLLIFQYEHYDGEKITINVDIFDSEKPTHYIYSDTRSGKSQDVDGFVNDIVKESLVHLGVQDSIYKKHKTEIKRIPVRTIEKKHTIGVRFGTVSADPKGPLHNSSNLSFDLYYSYHFPKTQFEIEPLITWDWGSGTLEKTPSVHLLSSFLVVKYCILPEHVINPYFGAGIGRLNLRRIREASLIWNAVGDPSLGLTLLGGLEVFWNESLNLDFRVKGYYGLRQYEEQVYYDEEFHQRKFRGGRLVGLDLVVGFAYKR